MKDAATGEVLGLEALAERDSDGFAERLGDFARDFGSRRNAAPFAGGAASRETRRKTPNRFWDAYRALTPHNPRRLWYHCRTHYSRGGCAMPFGGNDWLDLTTEEALEPDLPICDPHHHFWDMRSERIPYQRYLLHELADDVGGGHNVPLHRVRGGARHVQVVRAG